MFKHDILPEKKLRVKGKCIEMVLHANKVIIYVIQRSNLYWNWDNVHPPFVNR